MFAYCGNNPVSRSDTGGYFWDIAFDVVSLVVSVAEVVANPTDVGAWAGLVGDVIDVAIPCVGGLGEAIDAANAIRKGAEAVEVICATGDAITQDLGDIIEASEFLPKGDNSVYVSYSNGTIEYVGITNDFSRRRNEWKGTRDIQEIACDLDRNSARIMEQTIIDKFEMKKNGGVLSNKINSIGRRNSLYDDYLDFLKKLLK